MASEFTVGQTVIVTSTNAKGTLERFIKKTQVWRVKLEDESVCKCTEGDLTTPQVTEATTIRHYDWDSTTDDSCDDSSYDGCGKMMDIKFTKIRDGSLIMKRAEIPSNFYTVELGPVAHRYIFDIFKVYAGKLIELCFLIKGDPTHPIRTTFIAKKNMGPKICCEALVENEDGIIDRDLTGVNGIFFYKFVRVCAKVNTVEKLRRNVLKFSPFTKNSKSQRMTTYQQTQFEFLNQYLKNDLPEVVVYVIVSFMGITPLYHTLLGHEGAIRMCQLSSDDSFIITASEDMTLRQWDTSTGKCLRIFRGHTDAVTTGCLLSDDEHVVSGSLDKTLKLWHIPTGQCVQTFLGHRHAVIGCNVSNNNQFIVSSSCDFMLRVWTMTGICLQVFKGHQHMVHSCSFYPGDTRKIISTSLDDTIKVWDVLTGQCLNSVDSVSVSRFDFLTDQVMVATCYTGEIQVWSLSDMVCIFSKENTSSYSDVCVWSENNGVGTKKPFVVTARNKKLEMLDAARMEHVRSFEGHSTTVHTCCVSSDGEFIVSASHGGIINLWDSQTGDLYCC